MLREPKLSPRLHSSILPTSEYKSTILNPHWTIWSHLRNAKGPTLFQMSLKYPEPDIRLRSAVWVLFFIVCHVWRKCFPRIHSWELCITATACLMSNSGWTLGIFTGVFDTLVHQATSEACVKPQKSWTASKAKQWLQLWILTCAEHLLVLCMFLKHDAEKDSASFSLHIYYRYH